MKIEFVVFMAIKDEIKKVRDNVYEIPGSFNKKMRASGRLYIDDESFEALEEGAVEQIVNVACLPGVQRYSIGLPDIHFGYGFPIGGVAAFSLRNGIVSPGGVGFDINCGVRLIKSNLTIDDIKDHIDELTEKLFKILWRRPHLGWGTIRHIPCLIIHDSNLAVFFNNS